LGQPKEICRPVTVVTRWGKSCCHKSSNQLLVWLNGKV